MHDGPRTVVWFYSYEALISLLVPESVPLKFRKANGPKQRGDGQRRGDFVSRNTELR